MNRAVAICFAASVWVFPVAFSAGCGGDDGDDPGDEHGDHGDEHRDHDPNKPIGPPSGADCPDGSSLTYANFGKDFVSKYCLRCHSRSVKGDARMGAPSDHNFDTLSEIELLAMHMDQKAGAGPDSTNEMMPPSNPKPTLDERKKLGEWLACGVPE